MRWHFVATKNLEPWDWRSPDSKGIGNSETSQIEMSARLAQAGHDVTSYGWLPEDSCDDPRGTKYRPLESADFTQPGVWVLYRCPELVDKFAVEHPSQQVWLMMQDTHYDSATPERAQKLDRVLVLCEAHRAFIAQKFPELAGKLVATSNGVRVDMIEEVERGADTPAAYVQGTREYLLRFHDAAAVRSLPDQIGQRHPHRFHFSSSPDRGLKVILQRMFPRILEAVPDAELHVYYGWNNIDKLMETEDGARYFGPNKVETEKLLKQPGVHWHGRVGQRELTCEWLKAGLFLFPSLYPETGCATHMEAMALGAIPIAQTIWALGEHGKFGSYLDGDSYGDPLVIARFVAEAIRWCDPELQAMVRPEMMAWARKEFDWWRFVPQWEQLAGVGVREEMTV